MIDLTGDARAAALAAGRDGHKKLTTWRHLTYGRT